MKRGFTLIELLVVIVIIGLVTGIVIVFISAAKNRSKDAAVKSNLLQLRNRVELLYGSGYTGGPYGIIACDGGCNTGARGVSCSGINLGASPSVLNDSVVQNYLATLHGLSGDPLCDVNGSTWAVAGNLVAQAGQWWCVDSNQSSFQSANPLGPIQGGLCSP